MHGLLDTAACGLVDFASRLGFTLVQEPHFRLGDGGADSPSILDGLPVGTKLQAKKLARKRIFFRQ